MREEGDFEPNERMIRTKEAWAREKRGQEAPAPERPDRLPPGQHLRTNWPVLDLGYKPEIAQADWKLSVTGLVADPLVWTWNEFLAEATFRSVSDFHCVTSWSTYDNVWEGVSFRRLIEIVRPLSLAKFVFFTAFDDYTTNLPLEACDDDDVLLAFKWNGQPLSRDHGGPVRMIVPKRYAWKGAKWIKEIAFADRDQRGFWEVRGYSNTALPWDNDRYS